MKDRKPTAKILATDALNTLNMPERKVYDTINNWVRRVRGKIIDEKRRPIYRSVPISWQEGALDKIDITTSVETEHVLVLEIPIRELESMSGVEDWYERNIGGYSMDKFDHQIRQKFKEESLRKKHPGLQELWEKYQTMLALCDDDTFN